MKRMTDADIMAEYTDKDITNLKAARHVVSERLSKLREQLDREESRLDTINEEIRSWCESIRREEGLQ